MYKQMSTVLAMHVMSAPGGSGLVAVFAVISLVLITLLYII